MKKDKRFEILSDERLGAIFEMKGTYILSDRHTGVQYLFFTNGFAGGLTPLLDKDGKPVIDESSK